MAPDAERDWAAAARAAADAQAKPPGSLGLLGAWGVALAALQCSLSPELRGARLLLFAADHGVTAPGAAPGVSAYPRELSAAVFRGAASGGAASAVLCAANGAELELIDVGLDADVADVAVGPAAAPHVVGVVHAKVRRGSASMLAGPALTSAEAAAARAAGAAAVDRAAAAHAAAGRGPSGTLALAVGELGIGNTTAAAALVAALTGAAPEAVCGRGTGLDAAGIERKRAAVAAALAANAAAIAEGAAAALAAVGGLELAAMAGAFLRAAELGIPTLVDGFVSGAAALAALRIEPRCAAALFWSHRGAERGAALLLEAAGAEAALAMGLCLGEGTGAVLALPLLRSAAAAMRDIAPLAALTS
jgi:nicotinate-nucleotide--dimethylbenzimidazole phosphoribosyltransferase